MSSIIHHRPFMLTPIVKDCMKLLYLITFRENHVIAFTKFIHLINAMRTSYLCDTYIVFTWYVHCIYYDTTPSAPEALLFGKKNDLFSHPYLYATHRDDVH